MLALKLIIRISAAQEVASDRAHSHGFFPRLL